MSDDTEISSDGRALVWSGLTYSWGARLARRRSSIARRTLRVALLVAVTWAPLLLLSAMAGHATGSVKIPFLRDPEVFGRFLFVLPLLELAQVAVGMSLAVQTRQFVNSGIIPTREQGRFKAALDGAIRLRSSPLPEQVMLVLCLALSVGLRIGWGISTGDSSWERVGPSLTHAGWWHMLVSLPVLYFFLLRWIWVFLIWSWFLVRVSRLDLELTPTHPDRTGGLGFVGWGTASLAVVLMAFSAVMSAGFADEILHRGGSLDSLKYHVALFVIGEVVIVHLPLLAFTGLLGRCRFKGLLDFGALVWRYDRAFEEKWLKHPVDLTDETLLGSPDIQALASIATCYDHIDRMWPILFDSKAVVVLLLAALLPMVPLLATKVPLAEIFLKLGEMLA